MKRLPPNEFTPPHSTGPALPQHRYNLNETSAINQALREGGVILSRHEEKEFLSLLFQQHGNVFANQNWQARVLFCYNDFSMPYSYDGADRGVIWALLGPGGAQVSGDHESREHFLTYLAQQGFVLQGPNVVADLQTHLANFNTLPANGPGQAPGSASFGQLQLTTPAGFGAQLVAYSPPQGLAPRERPEMTAVAQNDVKAIKSFLTRNPASLATAQPLASYSMSSRYGAISSPSAGYSPITYAVKQDPDAKGSVSTICMWIVRDRTLPDCTLPPNILDFTDAHGETPLTTAVTTGASPDCVRLLVQAGANVNACNSYGQTPLTTAIMAGASPDCVDALIGAGADVNAPNAEGMPPLTLAVQNSNLPLVTALLTHNPHLPIGPTDPLGLLKEQLESDVKGCRGEFTAEPVSPETEAIAAQLLDVALRDLTATVEDPAATLFEKVSKVLVRWEQAEFLRGMISPQVTLAADVICGLIPAVLPVAAFETVFCHDINVAEKIIGDILTDANVVTISAWFAANLDMAQRSAGGSGFDGADLANLAGHLSDRARRFFKDKPEWTAEFLNFLKMKNITGGANGRLDEPGIADEIDQHFTDFTRLVWQEQKLTAALAATKEAAKGIPSWANNGEDLPPLMRALFRERSAEQIRAVLDNNCLCLYENVARINSRNWLYVAEGASDAFLAGRLSGYQYAEDIITKGFPSYPKMVAVQPGSVMREHPVAGASPLTFAVLQDPQASGALSEICMWVVNERGHNPNVAPDVLDFTDIQGNTPLTVAVQENHPACVDVLLESGAYVNAPDARGRTPLMRAAWAGNERMVYRLLNKGANPTAFHNGASAISLAAMNGNLTNQKTMDDIIHELLVSAPEHFDQLRAAKSATPAVIATALTHQLCTWLSLTHESNNTVREAALIQLRSLPSEAPNACATLFSANQEHGLQSFTDVLNLMSDLSCAEGDELASLIEPIYVSMWDQAIGAADLNTLLALFKEAQKRAASAADPAKLFAAHPGSTDLVARILTRFPQLARERLDSGDLNVSLHLWSLTHQIKSYTTQPGEISPFLVQINECLSGLQDVIQRQNNYKLMFLMLGQPGIQIAASREQTAFFIAELNRRGIDPLQIELVREFARAFWSGALREPPVFDLSLEQLLEDERRKRPFGEYEEE